MKVNHQRKLIEEALDQYRRWLDEIPDDQFDVTPADGGWSYSEVYSHVLQADFGSLIAAEKCARKTGQLTGKRANMLGHYVLLTGSFPPLRLNAPDNIASTVKKITKEEARNLLVKVRGRLEGLTAMLHNAPKDYKIKHPRLGMLNAQQWLKFTRIHTEHHLKQLKRIKKSFGKA